MHCVNKVNETQKSPKLTWEEIHKEEGVYRYSDSNNGSRLVVVKHDVYAATLVFFITRDSIIPAIYDIWHTTKFYQTDEKISIAIENT